MFPRNYIPGVQLQAAGNGPNIVTVTVLNEADNTPLQNVNVTAWEGTLYLGTAITDVNGEAVLNLPSGTFDIALFKSGFSGVGGQIVVLGVFAVQYLLSQAVITPSGAPYVTGYIYIYDVATGLPIEGATIKVNFISLDGTGVGVSSGYISVDTDVNGKAEFVDVIIQGGEYQAQYAPYGKWVPFVGQATTFALPNLRP